MKGCALFYAKMSVRSLGTVATASGPSSCSTIRGPLSTASMQRTSDANTESIVKIKTKDIMLEQQIQEDIKAAMKAKVREIIAQVGLRPLVNP